MTASMRPPQNAGEDYETAVLAVRGAACFNEAPAERGGRRGNPFLIPMPQDTLQ